jgi:hypothetical protein
MTTTNRTDVFAVAFKLHTLGFSVIPSGAGELHKYPLVPWIPYQQRQPTDADLETWQQEFHPKLWGIVTGAISGLVAIDADTLEARSELEAELGKPHVITPRGGEHWYFQHPGHPVKTVAGILPGVDIRADGGFVNIVGTRPDGEYQILRLPTPDNLLPWAKLPERLVVAMNRSRPRAGGKVISEVIPEGQRNATLTSLAGTMRRRGMPQSAIEAALLEVNQAQCQPPMSEAEVKGIVASMSRYPPNTGIRNNMYVYNASGQNETEAKGDTNGTYSGTTSLRNEVRDLSRFEGLSKRVQAWIEGTTGWWETGELDKDLSITDPKSKENRRKILLRLRDKGIIEPHPKLNKQFRFINTRITSLEFKTASNTGVLPLKWPMGIEKRVNLFPGNIAVVAGSPNAGKTALLLNLIHLNQDTFPIYYFCSEMGAVELRDRLGQFPSMAIEDWKFQAVERSGGFADVIVPDCVNIIDYLEMTTELYEVNTHLTAISHKLGSGIAIVALQKKQGAQYGRGQEFGLEKPKLYLSMDRGKLQIIKGKSWATKNVDPHGLEIGFKIVGGCQFEITRDWDWGKP